MAGTTTTRAPAPGVDELTSSATRAARARGRGGGTHEVPLSAIEDARCGIVPPGTSHVDRRTRRGVLSSDTSERGRAMSMKASQVNRRNMIRTAGAAVVGAVGASALHSAPAAAAGFGFTPITPYRSVDTRGIDKLPEGFFEDWDVWTNQSGSPRIPSNAVAVTFNLTAMGTEGSPGFLGISPAGASIPDISTLNWVSAGADVANGGTVKLGTSSDTGPGSLSVFCGGVPSAKTWYIIDITGYYS